MNLSIHTPTDARVGETGKNASLEIEEGNGENGNPAFPEWITPLQGWLRH